MGSLWITHLLLIFFCLELNQINSKSLPDHTNVDHNITLINPSDPRFSMLINGFAHGAYFKPHLKNASIPIFHDKDKDDSNEQMLPTEKPINKATDIPNNQQNTLGSNNIIHDQNGRKVEDDLNNNKQDEKNYDGQELPEIEQTTADYIDDFLINRTTILDTDNQTIMDGLVDNLQSGNEISKFESRAFDDNGVSVHNELANAAAGVFHRKDPEHMLENIRAIVNQMKLTNNNNIANGNILVSTTQANEKRAHEKEIEGNVEIRKEFVYSGNLIKIFQTAVNFVYSFATRQHFTFFQ